MIKNRDAIYDNKTETLKKNLTKELANILLLVLKFTIIDKYEIPYQVQITVLEKINPFYNICIFLLKLENVPQRFCGLLVKELIFILSKSDKLYVLNTILL